MYPALYMGMWSVVLLLVCCTPFGSAYNPECARRCDKDIVVVEGFENDEHCPISMPDNPYRHGDDNSGDILPCQIEIHSNCSNYCRIELHFIKFDLTPCSSNMTNAPEACDMVDGCEYILLHEKGVTLDGTYINHVTTFHGNHTDEIFVSQTDKVVLQLCYRSETFSARNMQITFGFIGIQLALMSMLTTWCVPATSYNPDCVNKCDRNGMIVESSEEDAHCSISMPDNPYRRMDMVGGEIIPCQIEIHSNCSKICHIELYFENFDLKPCSQSLKNSTGTCDMVDKCEYAILHERGVVDDTAFHHITHFHGNNTNVRFESQTDRILLQFCYRSETFSARNIHITYGAIDPTKTEPFYAGPLSVYIMGGVIVLLAVCICIIRWCPAVKERLDPPEDKNTNEEYL